LSERKAPVALSSPSGLRIELNSNGSIRRIDHGGLIVNLFLGSEIEGGPANLWLRRLDGALAATPLLGPESPARIDLGPHGLRAHGEWRGIEFHLSLRLAETAPAWFWHLALRNPGDAPARLDLIHAQDLALADYGAVRLNEYYVSHYVDYTPLEHRAQGVALAVRQNLRMGGRNPWALVGSLGHAASFATDALQLLALASRRGDAPEGLAAPSLPGRRRQHEHSMAVLQESPLRLDPGASAQAGFFVWLEPDHPLASSASDLATLDRALALPEAKPAEPPQPARGRPPAVTLFSGRPALPCRELRDSELETIFGGPLREIERDGERVLSFFTGASRHVVLRAKERSVLRPHGQIFRTGVSPVPDERSLTTTAWMNGVFHSMVTEGHVSINRLLSTTHGYLGLFRSFGQRVFVEHEGRFRMLDEPSAFEMSPSGARWIYQQDAGRIEVRAWAASSRHELWLAIEVPEGAPRRFLVSNHVALGGDDGAAARPVDAVRDAHGVRLRVLPDTDLGRRFPDGSFRIDPGAGTVLEAVGGDELLYADGESRGEPFLVLITAPAASVSLRITGGLIEPAPVAAAPAPDPTADLLVSDRFWSELAGPVALEPPAGPLAVDLLRWQEILPWYAHDAWIHYLAPRGLEQYSGGGWGTRDVCQGPPELLLALGRHAPIRDLLLRVFRHQNEDGDWPQWFMFFDRERDIRPPDSHGDIVFWPVLALAAYLLASEDGSILDERVPFFRAGDGAGAEPADLAAHVERALALIARRVIPGTRLAAYGHGDWNDSLQPADPSLSLRMCSAWTVTLQHHTLATLARALRRVGRAERAAALEADAGRIRDEFQRLLVVDGVVAGLACFDAAGGVEALLHPRDERTGIHFRLLPMIHAMLWDLLTPEQARTHAATIRRHLLGPDGARLFDRPPRYQGGPQHVFQRAESASYFGREIGVMYMHAHLRYAEAMAHLGDADALFQALRRANPIAITSVVESARRRQANCYYSSSDAWFADRYEASSRYTELAAGRVALEGGWRVYSSGPGIAVRLFHECLLGLRRGRLRLEVDPVLPPALDGLRARVQIDGRPVEVVYRVGSRGHGPRALEWNGRPLAFERTANPYREGGALVAIASLGGPERGGTSRLVVELG
jgi:cellobiose phosphorylase